MPTDHRPHPFTCTDSIFYASSPYTCIYWYNTRTFTTTHESTNTSAYSATSATTAG